jgi:hypothetical protein
MKGKRAKRSVRRTRAPKKGILQTNPYVTSQVGAAIGSVLGALYVEQPEMFSKAFDGFLMAVVEATRVIERADTVELLARIKRKAASKGKGWRPLLTYLETTLRGAAHVRPTPIEDVKKFLGANLREYAQRAGIDFQDGLREGVASSKKGSRS